MNNKMKIIIISDGTGETASHITRAVMTQFPNKDVYFTRYKNVRNKSQIESIFNEAAIHHDLILYTLVEKELREFIAELSRTKRIRSLDALGATITAFSNYFDQEPTSTPGLLYAVNDEYFKRVEAMEFTLNHDDGRNLKSLHLADIILVGISRTSKTPLSIFLSFHGYKVTNVPIIMGTIPSKELFEVDQRKIFALTIDQDALQKIRKNRLDKLGAEKFTGEYADDGNVLKEVEWANDIFAKNKRWPIFNVTDKALEDTASEIIKLLNMRKNNIFKQEKK